jgi:hypothetical protein
LHEASPSKSVLFRRITLYQEGKPFSMLFLIRSPIIPFFCPQTFYTHESISPKQKKNKDESPIINGEIISATAFAVTVIRDR